MPSNRISRQVLIFLSLTVTANLILAVAPAQDASSADVKLIRGKTLDAWIQIARAGLELEDRQNALQVLRNDGLLVDRPKTLHVFVDALSDKEPTVRSLAAAGLLKAGRPTDSKAAAKLIDAISKDMLTIKSILPSKTESNAKTTDGEVVFPIREIRALGVIGGTKHIPALRKIAENEVAHELLRRFAKNSIRQIEERQHKMLPNSLDKNDQPSRDK